MRKSRFYKGIPEVKCNCGNISTLPNTEDQKNVAKLLSGVDDDNLYCVTPMSTENFFFVYYRKPFGKNKISNFLTRLSENEFVHQMCIDMEYIEDSRSVIPTHYFKVSRTHRSSSHRPEHSAKKERFRENRVKVSGNVKRKVRTDLCRLSMLIDSKLFWEAQGKSIGYEIHSNGSDGFGLSLRKLNGRIVLWTKSTSPTSLWTLVKPFVLSCVESGIYSKNYDIEWDLENKSLDITFKPFWSTANPPVAKKGRTNESMNEKSLSEEKGQVIGTLYKEYRNV